MSVRESHSHSVQMDIHSVFKYLCNFFYKWISTVRCLYKTKLIFNICYKFYRSVINFTGLDIHVSWSGQMDI